MSPTIGSVVAMGSATKTGHDESLLLRHHPIGASTGFMVDLRGNWERLVEEAWNVSPFAVELSALSEDELPSLRKFLAGAPSLPFRYISIHGPSKQRVTDEEKLVSELLELVRHANVVVMHPDTIATTAPYRALGHKLVLENMDARKDSGRTGEELQSAFAELPEAGFCFDVAHAWSMDPDMSVAAELLDGFGQRLRHVHVSSLSDELHHVPLSAQDEELFRPALQRCVDVPWILEAPLRSR